jgi:aryl sulfotransferase
VTDPVTIWLASYPKSGNTWLRAMLTALTTEGNSDLDVNALTGGPIASSRDHVESWIGFASGDLTSDELDYVRPLCDAALDRALEEVRFRKIHDALLSASEDAPIVPPEHTRAAIYVVRDPRDVAVSYAHHTGMTHEWAAEELANRQASMFGQPGVHAGQSRVRLGTWTEHVREWTRHNLFPVLVVRYEDMSADPVEELTRVARFAGIDAGEDRIAAAVRAARFDALRNQETQSGYHPGPSKDRAFFRRGEAGAWREELAAELAAQVERDHGEAMSELGYALAASGRRHAGLASSSRGAL